MIKEAVEAGTQMVWKEDRLGDLGIMIPKSPTKGRTDAHVAAEYYGALEGVQPLTNGKSGDVWDKLSNDRLNAALAGSRAGDVREKLTDNLLKFSPLWWFLEFMPIVERKQAADDTVAVEASVRLSSLINLALRLLWCLIMSLVPSFIASTSSEREPSPSRASNTNSMKVSKTNSSNSTTPAAIWEGDGSYDALFHVSVKERMQLDDEDHLSRTWSSCFTKKEPYKPKALTSRVHPYLRRVGRQFRVWDVVVQCDVVCAFVFCCRFRFYWGYVVYHRRVIDCASSPSLLQEN